nr:ribosomal protein L16 [Picea glauca]
MGKGKGNPTGWIARASTGQIPFEMDGVRKSLIHPMGEVACSLKGIGPRDGK